MPIFIRVEVNRPLCRLLLALAFAAGVAGCGPRVVEKEGGDQGGENLLTLSRMYMRAQEKNNRPPRSADDLKPVAAEFGDLERALVSPNDHQPYVIVWNVDLRNAANPYLVVAYEKTGVNGFRYVLTATGVNKLSQEEFIKAAFPPGHRPG